MFQEFCTRKQTKKNLWTNSSAFLTLGRWNSCTLALLLLHRVKIHGALCRSYLSKFSVPVYKHNARVELVCLSIAILWTKKVRIAVSISLLAEPKTIDVNTQDLLVCEKHNRGIMRAKVHSRHNACKSTFEAWLVQKYIRGMTRAKVQSRHDLCKNHSHSKFHRTAMSGSRELPSKILANLNRDVTFRPKFNQQRQNCFWKTQELVARSE